MFIIFSSEVLTHESLLISQRVLRDFIHLLACRIYRTWAKFFLHDWCLQQVHRFTCWHSLADLSLPIGCWSSLKYFSWCFCRELCYVFRLTKTKVITEAPTQNSNVPTDDSGSRHIADRPVLKCQLRLVTAHFGKYVGLEAHISELIKDQMLVELPWSLALNVPKEVGNVCRSTWLYSMRPWVCAVFGSFTSFIGAHTWKGLAQYREVI